MRRLAVLVLGALALTLAAAPGAARAQAPQPGATEERFRVLVFSRTGGFRHASIEFGIAAIQRLGREHGFGVDATEDPAQFTAQNLRRYAAVVFLNTTGTVLDAPHKAAFEQYIRAGGGYVGIHSAADTEYEWPFYARLVGAYFKNHPLQQTARFVREDARHPATAHLAQRFFVFDEFYSFRSNPRLRTHVLLRIDESTYDPDPNTSHLPGGSPATGVMGDHPMSWCQDIEGGRSFYTALGHEPYLYETAWYLRHILGGIRTAAGDRPANCAPPRTAAGGGPAPGSGPSAPSARPALRLTRRCVGRGRLRMRLTGDTAGVRDVRFKVDRRQVRRDLAVPFDQVLDRRTLRRTRATRLRAVAHMRDGSVARVILSRTLPRCGLRR